jgi:O-antigen/teichoic acid export membrane protein
MMALTARWLTPSQYQSFVTWWAVATFFGTGFFVFETYTSRLVVKELAERRDPKVIVGLMTGRAWLAVALVSVGILAANSWLAHRLFEGNIAATLLLIPFLAIAMLQCVQRGVATGHRYFIMNASQFATDGSLRVLFIAGAYLAIRPSVAIFAAATCASAACSVVVANGIFPTWRARPTLHSRGESWRPLGFLLLSLTCVLLINNGAIIWLSGTHSVSPLTLGAFAGVMTLSQIPTQLSSAVTSPALSHLAYAIDLGDGPGFRQLHRRVVALTLVAGVLFVAVFGLFGHDFLSLYLGSRFTLARGYMILLAFSSALMLLAMVEQAVLSSRRNWSTAAVMWTFGSAAFGVCLVLPLRTITRATLAPNVAVAIALVGMWIVNRRTASREKATMPSS